MVKKILILIAFAAVAAALIFGAVYRTQARGGTGGGGQGTGTGGRNGSHQATTAMDGQLTNLPPADPSGLSSEEAEALV
jgi:hypothetical protein